MAASNTFPWDFTARLRDGRSMGIASVGQDNGFPIIHCYGSGSSRDMLRLLLEGTSNHEIAHRLVLSANTVKRHVYNICGKLGVQSRAQAIIRARALNLL